MGIFFKKNWSPLYGDLVNAYRMYEELHRRGSRKKQNSLEFSCVGIIWHLFTGDNQFSLNHLARIVNNNLVDGMADFKALS